MAAGGKRTQRIGRCSICLPRSASMEAENGGKQVEHDDAGVAIVAEEREERRSCCNGLLRSPSRKDGKGAEVAKALTERRRRRRRICGNCLPLRPSSMVMEKEGGQEEDPVAIVAEEREERRRRCSNGLISSPSKEDGKGEEVAVPSMERRRSCGNCLPLRPFSMDLQKDGEREEDNPATTVVEERKERRRRCNNGYPQSPLKKNGKGADADMALTKIRRRRVCGDCLPVIFASMGMKKDKKQEEDTEAIVVEERGGRRRRCSISLPQTLLMKDGKGAEVEMASSERRRRICSDCLPILFASMGMKEEKGREDDATVVVEARGGLRRRSGNELLQSLLQKDGRREEAAVASKESHRKKCGNCLPIWSSSMESKKDERREEDVAVIMEERVGRRRRCSNGLPRSPLKKERKGAEVAIALTERRRRRRRRRIFGDCLPILFASMGTKEEGRKDNVAAIVVEERGGQRRCGNGLPRSPSKKDGKGAEVVMASMERRRRICGDYVLVLPSLGTKNGEGEEVAMSSPKRGRGGGERRRRNGGVDKEEEDVAIAIAQQERSSRRGRRRRYIDCLDRSYILGTKKEEEGEGDMEEYAAMASQKRGERRRRRRRRRRSSGSLLRFPSLGRNSGEEVEERGDVAIAIAPQEQGPRRGSRRRRRYIDCMDQPSLLGTKKEEEGEATVSYKRGGGRIKYIDCLDRSSLFVTKKEVEDLEAMDPHKIRGGRRRHIHCLDKSSPPGMKEVKVGEIMDPQKREGRRRRRRRRRRYIYFLNQSSLLVSMEEEEEEEEGETMDAQNRGGGRRRRQRRRREISRQSTTSTSMQYRSSSWSCSKGSHASHPPSPSYPHCDTNVTREDRWKKRFPSSTLTLSPGLGFYFIDSPHVRVPFGKEAMTPSSPIRALSLASLLTYSPPLETITTSCHDNKEQDQEHYHLCYHTGVCKGPLPMLSLRSISTGRRFGPHQVPFDDCSMTTEENEDEEGGGGRGELGGGDQKGEGEVEAAGCPSCMQFELFPPPPPPTPYMDPRSSRNLCPNDLHNMSDIFGWRNNSKALTSLSLRKPTLKELLQGALLGECWIEKPAFLPPKKPTLSDFLQQRQTPLRDGNRCEPPTDLNLLLDDFESFVKETKLLVEGAESFIDESTKLMSAMKDNGRQSDLESSPNCNSCGVCLPYIMTIKGPRPSEYPYHN